jgi:hypothetical protein
LLFSFDVTVSRARGDPPALSEGAFFSPWFQFILALVCISDVIMISGLIIGIGFIKSLISVVQIIWDGSTTISKGSCFDVG